MTYSADLSTVARIDATTYAVTLVDGNDPHDYSLNSRIRVYFIVPVGPRATHASLDAYAWYASPDVLDAWLEAMRDNGLLRRAALARAAAAKHAAMCADEHGNVTVAYVP